MSSCLSGGRAYGFDIENIMKCQSTTSSSRNSHSSSSPSSTLSESSNSPITISNRKPRTPRKRPNQTYNEAAVLLSIACPKVFSTKNLTKKNNKNNKLSKFTRQCSIGTNSIHESSELLIENSGFLLHEPCMEKQKPPPNSVLESKVLNSCQNSPDGIEFRSSNSMELCDDGFGDDFDTESMLDEEMEEGIDSIMGNTCSNYSNIEKEKYTNTCYGYPMGLGFGGNLEFNFGFGMRNGVRALKNGDDGHWWNFPVVNVSPAVVPVKVKKPPVEKKKKKVEDLMKRSEPELELELREERKCIPEIIATNKLSLKLNYDDILNAWSDKGSPLPEEISGSESPGGDIHIGSN
uniref:protein CHLOROPLAST IMPORT APPARATUS 2 isoform X2 n=1 Tax=Erigeron canadensis TaxID=72917 RepID=UPI001CB89FE4|nr:protein CHLOROPLAST IMPORT APPARATUS 2 isoform X2 [Erigeron canadensis]